MEYLQRGKFNIVIGGQAGSEAKGKLSGWICYHNPPNLLVMAASPNAGHTCYTPAGEKKVSYHLPVGMVNCNSPVCLGPSSLINPDKLRWEIDDLGIEPARIIVDPRASIIVPGNIRDEKERNLSDIGSTLQGIGTTRIAKMLRGEKVALVGDQKEYFERDLGVQVWPTNSLIQNAIRFGTVLCEMTQGFDLDLEHGIDRRYCTSKMINPAMAMAEAGVPPQAVGNVWGVIRPFPIRVNNRTGTSGPYVEAKEITWGEVGRRCGHPQPDTIAEVTTTTKLPRRVFEFCWSRFQKFVDVCHPTHLCLQFANYLDWSIYGTNRPYDLSQSAMVSAFVNELEMIGNVRVALVGTGPRHQQMVDR